MNELWTQNNACMFICLNLCCSVGQSTTLLRSSQCLKLNTKYMYESFIVFMRISLHVHEYGTGYAMNYVNDSYLTMHHAPDDKDKKPWIIDVKVSYDKRPIFYTKVGKGIVFVHMFHFADNKLKILTEISLFYECMIPQGNAVHVLHLGKYHFWYADMINKLKIIISFKEGFMKFRINEILNLFTTSKCHFYDKKPFVHPSIHFSISHNSFEKYS